MRKPGMLGLLAMLLIAATVVAFLTERQSRLQLAGQNQALRQQIEQLTAQSETLSNASAAAATAKTVSDEQLKELLRLRSEVGRLREQVKSVDALRQENQQLRAALPGSQRPAVSPN